MAKETKVWVFTNMCRAGAPVLVSVVLVAHQFHETKTAETFRLQCYATFGNPPEMKHVRRSSYPFSNPVNKAGGKANRTSGNNSTVFFQSTAVSLPLPRAQVNWQNIAEFYKLGFLVVGVLRRRALFGGLQGPSFMRLLGSRPESSMVWKSFRTCASPDRHMIVRNVHLQHTCHQKTRMIQYDDACRALRVYIATSRSFCLNASSCQKQEDQ